MSSLCQRCLHFDIQVLNEKNENCLRIDLDAIIAGSESDCAFCSILHRDIKKDLSALRSEAKSHCLELHFYSNLSIDGRDSTKRHFNWMRARIAPRFHAQAFHDPFSGVQRRELGYQFYVAADPGTYSLSIKGLYSWSMLTTI
jgi:hypothetical protein